MELVLLKEEGVGYTQIYWKTERLRSEHLYVHLKLKPGKISTKDLTYLKYINEIYSSCFQILP